jgi:8-oxo-dGTP diphosphatase
MGKERFKLIPAVYLLLVRDDQVLLLRRYQTGYEDGNYSVVAGHVDGDEPARAAMVREAWEEAGLQLDPESLELAHILHRTTPNREAMELFFVADGSRHEPRNQEPHKCDDLSWFALDGLPANTIPYIRHVLECYRRGQVYSEYGWERVAAD